MMAVIAFPALLASILVGIDIRTDLSGLRSSAPFDDKGVPLVSWPELNKQTAHPARMIGYMMDASTPAMDGARVDVFILLPEAGQLLHPAHRNPDQMVEVRTASPVVFQSRQLVWVSGMLTRTIGERGSGGAAWAMTAAGISQASQADIAVWFH